MADVAVTVRQAIRSEQGELIDQEEHCSMDARTIAALGIADRRQVRITAAGRRAIYTLSETRDETADGVRMGLGGRRRVGQDDVFEAAASAAILDPDLPDQRAEAEGRFVERLADDGAQKALIIVAPHGGGIEPHTDEQAAGVAARLPADRVSTWVCKAFEPHAGACHVTSSAASCMRCPSTASTSRGSSSAAPRRPACGRRSSTRSRRPPRVRASWCGRPSRTSRSAATTRRTS